MADNHFSDKPSEGFQIPGKIILFGEYTILTGSRALALPLNQCSGKWTFQKNLEETSAPFQNELKAFAKYLEQITDLISFTINTEHFLDDLNKGLFFDSNIPIGYGAGSSGAIVAGVCLKYSDLMIDKLTDLAGLKTELGIMENHFHGASSGIDPLISLLNEPILINKNGEILRKNISAIPTEANLSIFLLDTGLTRKTGPLVEIFKTKLREQSFENEIQQQLIPVNNKAIEQLLVEEYKKLKTSFRFISQFQYNHFQEMIPDFLKEKWEAGLKHEDYTLKLCGAGGGGFLLGMTEHFEQTQKDFSPLQISVLKI